jgi:hypothetical protein
MASPLSGNDHSPDQIIIASPAGLSETPNGNRQMASPMPGMNISTPRLPMPSPAEYDPTSEIAQSSPPKKSPNNQQEQQYQQYQQHQQYQQDRQYQQDFFCLFY